MKANAPRDRSGRIATVIAGIALFVALGGTAAAVTAIPRDSVGSPQIRTDAVRAPEIAKDAVRSPEIAKDAVRSPEIADGAIRSSEIRDGGILLADISTGARNALQGAQGPAGPAGVAEARVAANASLNVPTCSDQGLSSCRNLLTRTLDAGSWVIQAKLDVSNGDFSKTYPLDHCGLAQGSDVLDTADFELEAFGSHADIENIALTSAVTNAPAGTTVALRCSEEPGEDVNVFHATMTALKVTTVIGP